MRLPTFYEQNLIPNWGIIGLKHPLCNKKTGPKRGNSPFWPVFSIF